MPELAEVETLKRYIEKHALFKKIDYTVNFNRTEVNKTKLFGHCSISTGRVYA